SVVERWASEGMPVRRHGRHVEATPDELNAWLGKESGKPVHVATEDTDLTAELKRGLSFVCHERPPKRSRKAKSQRGGASTACLARRGSATKYAYRFFPREPGDVALFVNGLSVLVGLVFFKLNGSLAA